MKCWKIIQSTINLTAMNRENIINKLTLLETSDYRKRGLLLTGKYTHEPFGFRNDLFEILDKLSDEDLKKLHDIKTIFI